MEREHCNSFKRTSSSVFSVSSSFINHHRAAAAATWHERKLVYYTERFQCSPTSECRCNQVGSQAIGEAVAFPCPLMGECRCNSWLSSIWDCQICPFRAHHRAGAIVTSGSSASPPRQAVFSILQRADTVATNEPNLRTCGASEIFGALTRASASTTPGRERFPPQSMDTFSALNGARSAVTTDNQNFPRPQ